ncbi:MAG: cation diffusion facilitator family transporter [Thermoplasmatota archaeon]
MESGLPEKEKQKAQTRVTVLGMVINLLLSVLKLFLGIVGRSTAMISDGVHSFSDLATDLVVIFGIRSASKPSDEGHEYGHGKIETFSAMIIALVLLGVGAGIGLSAVLRLIEAVEGKELVVPGAIALIGAVLSIILKEFLYWYTVSVGKRTGSKSLIANAWHHRSDALSSIAALIGIGGAVLLGKSWAFLDPLAALVVTSLIVWVSIKLLRESTNELLEGSLGKASEERIMKIARRVKGIKEPHNLRTRSLGRSVAIDLHVKVDHRISVKEGHRSVRNLEDELMREFGEHALINIHMDPDDE